jgi:hypothetical protein
MAFNDDSTRLAHTDHRLAEAARWMAENGFACGPGAQRKAAIEAYSSLAQLEGYEKWLMHRLGGEISAGPGQKGSAQIRHYERELRLVRQEIAKQRQARNVFVPPASPTLPCRQRKKSTGAPRKAAEAILLRHSAERVSHGAERKRTQRD